MNNNFEQGKDSLEEPRKAISELEGAFKDFAQENPEVVDRLKKELMQSAGIFSEKELVDPAMGFNFYFVFIPTKLLRRFSTMAGRRDNLPFSDKAIDLLESSGVNFLLALSDKEEFELASGVGKMDVNTAEKLSRLIEEMGGSFRSDTSQIEGWVNFSSE